MIKVGSKNKKEVTKLNHFLYVMAKKIMTSDKHQGMSHIGFQGISAFVDWLEKNYTMVRKEKRGWK